MANADNSADTRGVESVMPIEIDMTPSSLLDQARQGGVTKPNAPVTVRGGVPYDPDTLNTGLRGLADVEARARLGLDAGD